MRKSIYISAIFILLLLAGCSPYQLGPSFEPSTSSVMWDYGEKLQAGGPRFSASPLLVDDMIIVPSLEGKIYVFCAEKGKKYFVPESNKELYFNHKGKRVYMNSAGKEVEPLDSIYRSSHGIRSTVAHRQGIIYFGSFDKLFRGIDLETGHDRFAFETENYLSGSPLIVDDILYFGGYDTFFRAIDLTSSRQKWQFKTEGKIRGGAVETSIGIAFGNESGTLYHLDKETGTVIWEVEGSHEIYGNPAYIDGLIICADLGGQVRVFHEKGGTLYWEYKTDPDGQPVSEEFWVTPAVDESGIYLGSSWGKFYALKLHPDDPQNPVHLWGPFITHNAVDTSDSILADAKIVSMESSSGNPTDLGKILDILFDHKNTVATVAVSASSGSFYFIDFYLRLRESLLHHYITNGAAGKRILFGCNDGKMYCLDGNTGNEIWAFKTFGEIRSKPVIYNNIVAFPSNDYYFYGLDLKTGQPVRGQIHVE